MNKKELDQYFAEEPSVDYGKIYTYADYMNFEFEEMVEIIRGKLFRMSPAPRTSHQAVVGNLYRDIANFLKKQRCKAFISPYDVILPIKNLKRDKATTVVQPDIVVVCNPDIIEEAGCFGVPDFLIEVLSPFNSRKDLRDKYSVYEEAGVKEYWIVMPKEELVEVFLLVDEKYKRIQTYVKSDTITPYTIPDLTIDLTEIF